MEALNLPPFEPRFGGTQQRPTIYDPLRRRYVALTPEEWVRQHFVNYLTAELGYPRGLLANEVELRVGEKRLRCDTLLYNRALKPVMIIEYKAPTVAITQRTLDQATSYNLLLHVDYLVMSNGRHHFCCRMDYERHTCSYLPSLPPYNELSPAPSL